MSTVGVFRRQAGISILAIACAVGVFVSHDAQAAGSATVTGQAPGKTPFLATISANYTGGTIASIGFGIQPKSGSVVRPAASIFSAAYLMAQGDLTSTSVNIPVFALYAGSSNTVYLYFRFTDGSTASITVPVTTATYTDPCAQVNQPTVQVHRGSTNALDFDYFVSKDYCSTNSPAIVDTDGNLRWVGTAGVNTQASIFYDNAIFASDGQTGINRIDIPTGQVKKIGDYGATYGITFTGHHNIDPGRNGMIVDVNTTTQTEAFGLEINKSGAVLNAWDYGRIISKAMIAGGDDPTQFVYPVGTDWFHNNAVAYNPADNTLIVSSRENFVMAVDYDPQPDGVKKIHWILGDTTKKWYQFPSLRKFALTLGAGTMPPIGQHAVSIDHKGNLLLFNDGAGSFFQSPPGITRTYSTANSYQIDTKAMTANAVFTYSPQPSIYSPICGSVYDVFGNYLIDFATSNNYQIAELQGLGPLNSVVFDLKYPQASTCGVGWNAFPILSRPLQY